MWKRDAGVQLMIDYLDKDLPLKYKIDEDDWDALPSVEKWGLCSPAERNAIMEQGRECVKDFTYAARNYFWITTKKKKDELFSLWEAQHLILQCYYDLKERGRAQKIIITKGRQLGCSTLIEGMIAWRSMFFPNTRAIVVSVDQPHSSYLFGLMAHIYDRMPWWLKPMIASRKNDFGLWFQNPDEAQRLRHPGLDSKVMVQWSNQYSGVGQGIPVDAAHVSEYADFFEEDLEAIVNEDLGNSMADEVEVFGFMESTGKGAGSAAHKMWRSFEKRMDQGKWPKWYPLFLPSFFETTRVMAPPNGWIPPHQEVVLKNRARDEWVKCDNPLCGRHRKSLFAGESTAGTKCFECKTGILKSLLLSDNTLFWHQDRREQAEDQGQKAVRQFKQEMSCTAEECWQVSGYVLFDDACREWMQETIIDVPLKKGALYRGTSEIHGADARNEGRCYIAGCTLDHRHDETPLWIWEEPVPGVEYSIGADVSEGIGEDYCVAFVNKIGKHGAGDMQVAVWRDNHTKPKEFAFFLNVLGRWYNDALMSVEHNTYQTTGDDLLYKYSYPNLFRWKNLDSVHPLSGKWHWWTKANTKSSLHQTAVDWLHNRCWIIRSRNLLEETKVYQKEEFASRSFGAAEGCNDDELMAGMIALYTAHDMDCDDSGRVRIPSQVEQHEPARWQMTCQRCQNSWGSANPEMEYRCPFDTCGSLGPFTAEFLEPPDPTPCLKKNDERPIMDQVKDLVGKDVDRYKGTSFDLQMDEKFGSGTPDVTCDML